MIKANILLPLTVCSIGIGSILYGYFKYYLKIIKIIKNGDCITNKKELTKLLKQGSLLKFRIQSLGIVKLPTKYCKMKGTILAKEHPLKYKIDDSKSMTLECVAYIVLRNNEKIEQNAIPWACELSDKVIVEVDSKNYDIAFKIAKYKDLEIRYLSPGDPVFIIGVLTADEYGNYQVKAPYWNWYYITNQSEMELMSSLNWKWKKYMFSGLGLLICGSYFAIRD